MDISGKVVIITGASAGIGQVTAQRLAATGAKVVLVARSTAVLTALAEDLSRQSRAAWPIPADMRDRENVARLVDRRCDDGRPKIDKNIRGRICEIIEKIPQGFGERCSTRTLLAVYRRMRRIHVILDNFGIPKSAVVAWFLRTAGSRIRPHFLPPHCPDENKIERHVEASVDV